MDKLELVADCGKTRDAVTRLKMAIEDKSAIITSTKIEYEAPYSQNLVFYKDDYYILLEWYGVSRQRLSDDDIEYFNNVINKKINPYALEYYVYDFGTIITDHREDLARYIVASRYKYDKPVFMLDGIELCGHLLGRYDLDTRQEITNIINFGDGVKETIIISTRIREYDDVSVTGITNINLSETIDLETEE